MSGIRLICFVTVLKSNHFVDKGQPYEKFKNHKLRNNHGKII